MELVRRHSGDYNLALPWLLPVDQRGAELMNSEHSGCLDCRRYPPPSWKPVQVAAQVRAAGLQGATTLGGVDVSGVPETFARARVGGRQLLNLTTPSQLRALGVPRAADALLLPWTQRLRNVHLGRNWGAGAYCCASFSSNMPTLEQWRRMLLIPEWGPLRASRLLDAFVDRDEVGRFLGKKAHVPMPLARPRGFDAYVCPRIFC